MAFERPLNTTLLVTLLCPKCKKRVAVMDHFPNGKEKVGDITLIDGRTAKKLDRLVCPKCFTSFPPAKAAFPESEAARAAQNPGDASAMKEISSAESALSGVMGRLFALAEAYPNLKANETMISLMEELTSTENKVSFARQAYNDAVMTYNTRREVFPTNFIASTFNFGPAELFVIEKPEQKEAPKVAF